MTRPGIGVAVTVAVTATSVAAAGPIAAKQRVAIASYGAEANLGCPLPLGGFDCGIYIMNRDGSGETQVPNVTASFAEANLDWQPLPPFQQNGAPATLTVGVVPGRAGLVTSAPEGLECPSVCSAEFDRGSSVRLAARPTGAALRFSAGPVPVQVDARRAACRCTAKSELGGESAIPPLTP